MMTAGTFAIIALLYLGHRWGYLAIGSVVIGLLVGLAFSNTASAQAVGQGVRESSAAIGQGVKTAAQSTADALVKDKK